VDSWDAPAGRGPPTEGRACFCLESVSRPYRRAQPRIRKKLRTLLKGAVVLCFAALSSTNRLALQKKQKNNNSNHILCNRTFICFRVKLKQGAIRFMIITVDVVSSDILSRNEKNVTMQDQS
jgi:hypothetical protein